MEIIDGGGAYLSPGFINIYIHGVGESDTMEITTESLDIISKIILKDGVTSYLPTRMTMKIDNICKALDNVKKYLEKGTAGLQVIGVHI